MDRPDEARTTDIFEQISGYPKPPLISLPHIDHPSSLAKFGLKDTALARSILNAATASSGFARFVRNLHGDDLEALLRSHNLRLPGLFAPCLSATAALQDDPRLQNPFHRAASLVFGAYSLQRSVFSAELEPDKLKDQPMEMGQYPNLFSTQLLVQGKMPRLFKSVIEPQITVIVGGRLHILYLGDLKSETWVENLAATLARLAGGVHPAKAGEISPGLFTAADSPTQLRIFNLLSGDETNARTLRLLRRSMLTLCLDLDQFPDTPEEAFRLAHSTNFANRWFHSSLQLVVFGNASACAIMNFTAYLDGNVMMRGAAEIQRRAAVYPFDIEKQGDESQITYQEASWNLDPKLFPPRLLQRAQADIESIIDPQPATFELPEMGRQFFESRKLNPIPTFILALQAAANGLTGHPLLIDQFVSLSAYRCMDVTTTQVSTPEVQAFAAALSQASQDTARLQELFQAAIASQVEQVHKARASMPMEMLIQLYVRSLPGGPRFMAMTILGLSMASLAILGQVKLQPRRDIIVSHPEIHTEVPLVGRPGIRLPYAGAFGLHYQIWPHKTVLTYMPGIRWKISNADVSAAIQKSLARIGELF